MKVSRISVAFCLTFALIATLVANVSYEATQVGGDIEDGPTDNLCLVLENVSRGSRYPVVVSGMLLRDGTLYDPHEPICRLDVQPCVLVDIKDVESLAPKLKKLLKEDGRALVTLSGVIVGPRPLQEKADAPIGVLLAEFMRKGYGFQHDFRAKMEVSAIRDVQRVPERVPQTALCGRPPNPFIPTVVDGALPHYPRAARILGIQGTVNAVVKTHQGHVVDIKLLEGNHLLWEATRKNIETWKFDEQGDYTFTTTFIYQLEKRLSGQDDNDVIDAKLPLLVRIVGPAFLW